MVLRPERPKAEAIFRKWGLISPSSARPLIRRFVIRRGGEVKADLPIKELGDQAPLYNRPWIKSPHPPVLDAASIPAPIPNDAALLKLIGSPNLCSKRWIYEQYDTLILGNTVQGPGGDAAVVRLGDGPKGLRHDRRTERYCAADPREGKTGGRRRGATDRGWRAPAALTDNLNFGNPERSEAMGELVGTSRALARPRGCSTSPSSPAMSRSTMRRWARISPTPRSGASALSRTCENGEASPQGGRGHLARRWAPGWLGQSAWLATVAGARRVRRRRRSCQRRNGEFVASLIRGARVSAVHDLSDAGLPALAEMAMAGELARRRSAEPEPAFSSASQGRDVLTAPPDERAAIAEEAKRLNVPISRIGVTGGDALRLGQATPVPLAALREAYETWLPAYMSHPQGANS